MSVGHFHIPGETTKREYAVYVMVARHRRTGRAKLYVGKTGDNRDGCNPVISRAGNHFSFNRIHSQVRNKLPGSPSDYDFDFFSTTFGRYVSPDRSRRGIEIINEMERRLNKMTQEAFGEKAVLNPFKGTAYVKKADRDKRASLARPQRIDQLSELVEAVRVYVVSESGNPGVLN